jgi:hypothetical protein
MIQKVNAQWKLPCFSCHHQTLGDMAIASARLRGIAIDENLALQSATKTYRRLLDVDGAMRIEELIDPALSEGSMLSGAIAAGVPPNLVTTIYARHIANTQQADGHFPVLDGRPPQGASEFTAAAYAVRAISHYLPKNLQLKHLDRARAWLSRATPYDTEDASNRLLGLSWAKAPAATLAAAARHLASLQQPDGSWRQTPTSNASDAYATAQALFALASTQSLATGQQSFQNGIDWLLRNQAADGTWHVKTRIQTRAPISPPYFESGFPYGKDQFISSAATALAVLTLAEALPLQPNAPKPLALPAFDDTKLSWATIAQTGSLEQLSKIDPNAATPGGTSALMLAAHDPAKVALLLTRGANPKARTSAGLDALMIAALQGGNTKSLELLIQAGLTPNPNHKVRFDAHALAHALMANDTAMVRFLISKGADAKRPMKLLGGFPMPPLLIATSFNNDEAIRILVQAGASVDQTDDVGMTPLSWSVQVQFRQDSARSWCQSTPQRLVRIYPNRPHQGNP